MKNLKKVLAMVLAFACTFTMFASAKMYEDVQPGTEFSEAITMLSDLGIIQGKTDNKYHPEDTITRAEACALIARLMTGDPNAAGFNGAHHFKDVPAGHWASSAIGYAVVNGIAVGVDQAGTRFEPNRPIKDKEFVTMIVRALGYETPDMRNNFPFGYMSAANAIGLLQDVNMVPDTDALRGEDAQVIYNAMFVDYARGAKRVNVAHGTTVEKYPTLAEDVWHLDRAAVGTWDKHDKDDENVKLSNCKAHTWVIVGQDGDDNILAYPIEDGNTEKDSHEIYESLENKVNGVKAAAYKFKYEGTADIDTLRGYKVELWGAGKHGEPSWEKKEGKYVFSNDWKIKAIKTIAGQTKFDYDASKADSKRDNGEIKVDDETTLKLGTAADNAQKVSEKNTSKTDRTTYLSKEEYNRENVTSDKKVEAALNVRDGAQYRLMDWDGDKEIDWVVVSEASYYKVEAVSSKRLTVTSMVDSKTEGDEETQTKSKTETWKLDDDNKVGDYKITYKAPEGLKEGDIIEVAYSTGWDKITGTISVVEPENHKLEKVATKDHLTLTFDGQVTELAQNKNEADTIVPTNPTKYINFDEEELGTEFAVAKNRNGFIIHSDYATDTANYLMVLDTDDGKNTVRGELGAMKILTADNKVETNVEVVSDLMIDRKTSGNGYDKDTRFFDETKVVGNVYKYWKDADGRITKLESMIDFDETTAKADKKYDYVAKNDRLTLVNSNESYALKDAKVIFAVKPHDGDNDYIQHEGKDLKVDDADVLAVKQADIPDIGGKDDDTQYRTLDKNAAGPKSWVADPLITVAVDTDNNKDINAAVLGVNNFNKFNAGSTKVGLVTNVSYNNNHVLSLEVATNGKVEEVSSVEKTDFDDIVSVKDYENDKSVSVGSRTETINVGVMKGKSLKEYLHKNGAYAEITTDKDGKLTGVLFMDNKTEQDGDSKGVNYGNVVVGNYYQVSRKVIADVKSGSWMSVIKGSAMFADEDTFRSMDSKNTQKASNFASDANYYVIDGKPTRNDKDYTDTKATILDGFDGTPNVKVGEASDVVASEINNSTLTDRYNVADVATKIDKDGAGDVVAVYAYKDDMDETDAINMASVAVKKGTVTVTSVKPGDTVTVEAYVTDAHNLNKLDRINVYQDGRLIDTITKIDYGMGTANIVATYKIPASASGNLTFKGAYSTTEFGGGVKVKVDTADTKFVADTLQFATWNGTKYVVNPASTSSGTLDVLAPNKFAIHVAGDATQVRSKTDIDNLEIDDLKVTLAGKPLTIAELKSEGEGFYTVTIADKIDLEHAPDKDKVLAVSLTGKNIALASGMTALVANPASHGTPGTGGTATGENAELVEGAGNVANIVLNNEFNPVEKVTTFEVKAVTGNGKLVTSLETNITAEVKGVSGSAVTVTEKKVSAKGTGIYTVTATTPDDLRGKTVEFTVKTDRGNKKFSIHVPVAEAVLTVTANDGISAVVGKTATGTATVSAKNLNDLKLWVKGKPEGAQPVSSSTAVVDNATGVAAKFTNETTVTLEGTVTHAGTTVFVVGVLGNDNTPLKTAEFTVEAKEAVPTLADGDLKATQTKGEVAVTGKPAKFTAQVTANTSGGQETIEVALKSGANTIATATGIKTTESNNDTTAQSIVTALQAALKTAQKDTAYTVSKKGSAGQIVVEAAEKTEGEVLTLELTTSSVTTKLEKTGSDSTDNITGKADKPATPGTLEFTVPAGATADGDWKFTIDSGKSKNVIVSVQAGNSAEKIAQLLVAKVNKIAELEASNNGATVTIKEKAANAGTIFADTQVNDVKFEKQA